MRKLTAILATAALMGTANVGLADDTSTGTTTPNNDMQMEDSTNMQNDSSMSHDGSMEDGTSTTEGQTTGKGKQLNKGKTQTEPASEGGRIKR